MTAEELAVVMRRSGYTRDDLATMYNREAAEVDDWLEGRSRVPRSVSMDLGEVGASLAVGAEVERQIAASGLGKCQWLAQFSEENPISLSQFQEHAKTCAICGERERLAQTLAPKRIGVWSRLRRWVGL